MLTVRMPLAIAWLALSLAGLSPQIQVSQRVLSPVPANVNQTARRTVTGSVVNSLTGEPIRRAIVHINGAEQHAGFTGADGRFEVANVPDGAVQVNTQKPGYFEPNATLENPYPYAPISVTIGPATGELQLKLVPQSSIEGRVTGSDGEALEGVAVQVVISHIINGRRQWQPMQNAQTGEDGRYEIDKLPAGSYIVKTGPHSALEDDTSDSSGVHRPDFYRSQFYPNSPDAASSQPFQLQPGQNGQADFTLKPVPSYSASGSFTGVRQGASLMCLDENGEMLGSPIRFDVRTARFTLSQLPPGACTLHIESPDSEGQIYVADLPIQIEASDLRGLRLELRPATSMQIHVAGSIEQQGSLQVQLTSTTRPNRPAPAVSGQTNDTQHPLELKGIEPDTYKASVHFFGQGCIGSVLSGSQDLLRNNLTISLSATPPPMEVTLRTDCANLSGSVKPPSADKPVTGFLILIPDSFADPQVLPLPPDGSFAISNLTPGAYRVFAFSSIDGLEYANPESLRSFDGEEVTLEPNGKATVQVSLIMRGVS